jgi:hypothetical protein
MHDHDLDPAKSPARRKPEVATGDRSAPTTGPILPAGHHDAASLMHLQRTAGNAGVIQLLAEDDAGAPSPVHDVVGKGGGTPLDEATRASMEGRFGEDFGDVRVHTDAKASESAKSVGANAYTVGSDIVFRSGQFDAASPTGQRTLAHELTHVVQQRSGPVDGTDAPGGIRLSDPGDAFERAADQTANAVMSAPASGSSETAAVSAVAAQRELETGETSVQPTLQREEIPEEEIEG